MLDTFAKRLQYAMSQAEMKQYELAEKIGAPRSAISQYLSGKNTPNPGRLEAMANATGVTASFLTGDESTPAAKYPQGFPSRITPEMAARCLRTSAQAVRVNMLNGKLPIGRALQGAGDRHIYIITPEKLREEAGESRFNEFFGVARTASEVGT